MRFMRGFAAADIWLSLLLRFRSLRPWVFNLGRTTALCGGIGTRGWDLNGTDGFMISGVNIGVGTPGKSVPLPLSFNGNLPLIFRLVGRGVSKLSSLIISQPALF